jgi:hypothetical protein
MSDRVIILTEESQVDYNELSDLSYYETGTESVDVYVEGIYIGEIEVFTDRENDEREYICINYEMVYLDTIECINPE